MEGEKQTQKPDGILMKHQKLQIASQIGKKSVISNAEINVLVHIHKR
jgi:hypothetical protein